LTDRGILGSSFRDPSGFVFRRDGVLYRQVNRSFAEQFDFLGSSGLYEALTSAGLLIPHVEEGEPMTDEAHTVLRPEPIPFISLPAEWCFSELKEAALATLRIQEMALDHGMSLRDASAYNIQFRHGRPVLIDTLSFEPYRDGEPWVAYRQFCQHFLAPLALMAYRDVRLSQLLRANIDGLPLDLAAELLPRGARSRMGLRIHLVAHAKSQRRHEGETPPDDSRRSFSLRSFRGLLDSLASAVRGLRWDAGRTTWSDYYAEADHYTAEAFDHKKELVTKFLEEVGPSSVWDLGGNVGVFARIASERGIPTVCFDLDAASVEANYQKVLEDGERDLLPLVLDLTNPTPSLGWAGRERPSLAERGPADLGLALALVHHLAIGNNVPLGWVADYFADLARWLVIEFVPKADPKVQTLLATREDIFPDYTVEGFEGAFAERFVTERREPIAGSERVMYLLRAREMRHTASS
jgi:ribosomal protein L11 methylase PrmA